MAALASTPPNGDHVNVVLARFAEYHRTLQLLGDPMAEPSKVRHLIEVLPVWPIYVNLRENFHLLHPELKDQSYARLVTMVVHIYNNRIAPPPAMLAASEATAYLAVPPAVQTAVTKAMSTSEIKQAMTSLNSELKSRNKGKPTKSKPANAKHCDNHPNSTSHTTAECKFPKGKPAKAAVADEDESSNDGAY